MWFILVLAMVTVAIAVVAHQVLDTLPSWYYQTLTLLFVTTLGIYGYLIRTKQNKPEQFVQSYLATLVAKLLMYGAYLLIIIRTNKEDATVNAGLFLVTYLIFTALEVGFLYRRVNR